MCFAISNSRCVATKEKKALELVLPDSRTSKRESSEALSLMPDIVKRSVYSAQSVGFEAGEESLASPRQHVAHASSTANSN